MKRFVLPLVALAVVWPACGQSQNPAAPQPSGAPDTSHTALSKTSPAADQKPAKVWTNDDVDKLQGTHGVSVVGDNSKSKQTNAPSQKISGARDAAWYRSQLDPLRAGLARLDVQIAKLHAFINGENVNYPPNYWAGMPVSPQDQLKKMEQKRDADAAKISDLEDRARHDGILPGALR